MILQSLHALYDRLVGEEAYDLVPSGFSPQQISFRVVLHPDGRLHKFEDARVRSKGSKWLPVRVEVLGEDKKSGNGLNPGFLWDKQAYLLGRPPKGKPATYGEERFESFRQRHLGVEQNINHPEFSAVCRFLEAWSPDKISAHPILDEMEDGLGIFHILGESKPVLALSAVRNWWLSQMLGDEKPSTGQCLLTGDLAVPLARLHPKIKGVINAQTAGAYLVSFNDSSYESYGKTQSFNSPVSTAAAFRYGTALNALLRGPQSFKHRLRIGDSTCVFWTDRPTILEDAFAGIATGGDHALQMAQDAQDPTKILHITIFLKALRSSREEYDDLADDPEGTRFFLLGLAPNAARLSVRFFYQSSIRELLDHLRRHVADTRLVRQFEQPVGNRRADPEFPAYWEYLRETVRQGDDPPPLLGGALMRAILEGTPYPESLLGAVIRRVQTERAVNYLRAAAIKAVLVRNHQLILTPMLDLENTQPAYLRGRLFAVLEKIQEEGHREQTGSRTLEKTIRETYFSVACTTPASVFPRLQQLSTHHRRHLNPGRRVQFDQLIADIEWPLSPGSTAAKSHTLEEQGLFILGYYHQRKALFTRKEVTSDAETAVEPALATA